MKNRSTGKAFFKRFALSTVFASSVIILTANFAFADRFTDQIYAQLIRIARDAGYRGYRPTHEPLIDDLGNGGEHNITLNLSRDVSYVIMGVCDEDCNDIDLELYDDNGNLISSDRQIDAFPVVEVTPRWNARFLIRVRMADCSNAPCRYGVGAFGR
jgi:hypothetical protein